MPSTTDPAGSVIVETRRTATASHHAPAARPSPPLRRGRHARCRWRSANGTIRCNGTGRPRWSSPVTTHVGTGDIGIRFGAEPAESARPIHDRMPASTISAAATWRSRRHLPPQPVRGRPRKPYATIQAALDAASAARARTWSSSTPAQPDRPSRTTRAAPTTRTSSSTPRSSSRASARAASRGTPRARLDHRRQRLRRRHALATAWRDKVGGLTWVGNQAVDDGRRSTLLASQNATGAEGAARHSPRLQGRHRRLRHPRRRPDRASRATSTSSPAGRPVCRPTSRPRAARSSPTPTPATCRSRTTSCRTTAARTRHDPHRHARPAGAGHQPAQRQHPDREQPDHRQRRHEPGRRHRALRRVGQLRGRPATTSAATSRPSTAAGSATTA